MLTADQIPPSLSLLSNESMNYTLSNIITGNSGLKLAHLNVSGMCRQRKIDHLRFLLPEKPFYVFTLSKTFLNNRISEDDVAIDGYYLYRKDRPSRGAGVAMYIEDDLHREMCSDLTCRGEVEVVCGKVKTTHNKRILICSAYRPPSANHAYFDYMLQMLRKPCVR